MHIMDTHMVTDIVGFAVILVTFIWKMGRVELKIDLMWEDFSNRVGLRKKSASGD